MVKTSDNKNVILKGEFKSIELKLLTNNFSFLIRNTTK